MGTSFLGRTLAGMPDHRAHFDFEIRFANGGDLIGSGFRLDLPAHDIDEAAIGRLLIEHLGLALVDTVELRRLRIIEEPHRGSRGVPVSPVRAGPRIVDLSHPIRAGLITYPGLPAPVITPHLTREDSRAKYAPGTEFAIDVITMIGNTGTYLDSPFHRFTATPMAPTWPASPYRLWSGCAPRSSTCRTRGTPNGGVSAPRRWLTGMCGAQRCCCTRAGNGISAPSNMGGARRS
jgi:hypothetical protein